MTLKDCILSLSNNGSLGKKKDSLNKNPSHSPLDTGDIDECLSLSIEGKRREVLRRQMLEHIHQMKVLKFDFKA